METLSYPKETKARKKHSCDFCGDKIIVGEKYIKSTHVFDGQIYDWKTHKYCYELANKLKMYDDCDEGVTQDIFFQSVNDKHDDILISQIPEKDASKYGDIIRQLTKVRFKDKLWFVIRYINKLD
jgi:hypothetical protein